MQTRRRAILKAGLGAGSLFLPLPYAWVWAQSEGTVKLLRLPKIALVVGNSKYKESPLKNPANDAKAIGDALKSAGFAVTAKLDASRADMAAAIGAYVKELAAKKCVGLFYYAGHGIQLAWKNYMLPVDADVDTIEDVHKRAVEVNQLMEGLTKAANPFNVIILDACRDNPFGTAKPTQQKGLSQMDAPANTILAYATSPGNVASDGDGANGLYTENLLRELKVPEAKVEDVFKRVRLAVRRKSNGAQIPWESTSLEEDFYFLPPQELKKLSDAEKERLFKEELALWEKIQYSKVPAPLVDYLSRYPSGKFSELAQLQLDRVLAAQGERRVEIAARAGNPYTKGSARADTKYRVGDSYTYREIDAFKKTDRMYTRTVSQITDSEVIYSNGLITDLLGNNIALPDGRRYTPNQGIPTDYAVGKKWTTRYSGTLAGGEDFQSEFLIRITAREIVKVPAGTFDAFRVEYEGLSVGSRVVQHNTINWFAPDKVRRPVSIESKDQIKGRDFIQNQRRELVSFKQS